jgi:hypothetical protein
MSRLLADQGLGTLQAPSAQFGANDAVAQPGEVLNSLETIISTGLGVLTVVAGIFFLIFFFMAAFKWQTAGGEAAKVQKARDEMVQGVIGMILIVAAYGIIGLIGSIIGIDILNPAAVISDLVQSVTP